jgi:uncharacterized protein involved in exopolysaccharide biosynthesis/Mrp family chromosome partitioning ATPase
MSTNRNLEAPVGISLADIYFVIFRHKWKIILVSLAGIVAAVALYFHNQPPYQSQAELLIKYVSQARSLSLSGSDQNVIMPGSSGEDVINSEILILTSLDLAEQAVTNFGAAKILPNSGGDSNVIAAAVFIRNNLVAEPAGKGSSVISVTLKHPDPLIVQPLLTEVINDYFQKHKEIHSAGGQFDDVLTAERADLGNQLNDTEQRLASLKSKANIISLDDSKKGLAEQMSKVQGAILDAQAELAGYEAAAKQMGNGPAQKQETTNAPAVPRDQIDAYNDVCTRLDLLRKKQQDYLVLGYTGSNVVVRELGRQIASTQMAKSRLEDKYPQITGLGAAASTSGGPSPSPMVDLRTQAGQIAALEARLHALDAQLDKLQLQATNLNSLAPAIANLEQTRTIQQANYQNLATKLENSHIDEALDTGKTPNIKWVQSPSPPFRDWKKTYKTVVMVAFGGLIAGLAWAFLIEFYLDRSIKRPVDLSAKLRIPFFLSIPDLNHNRRSRLAASERRQLENGDQKSLAATANGNLEIASPLVNHALHSHYDALRDRLVNYFDSINLTRKPKLVAVTSTAKRAGVSTIAAGLAASLSETGDGRVLLVDMNLKSGAAQQFVNGKPGCQLDDALVSDKRENALVQENLYVVSEASNASNLPRILPKRFASLVPKLKSSDYDYIIFDMPPVTQTSVTTRLAGFMDMVMLVIESEKTDREAVQQANQLLMQSKSNVTAVLNKTRKYVPARLQHDLEADV